ncbi:MAG TPA: hypothetical protein VGC54_07870 [Planctomycetota bacterium]
MIHSQDAVSEPTEVELFQTFDVQELVARIEFKKRKSSSKVGSDPGDFDTQEGGSLIECLYGC